MKYSEWLRRRDFAQLLAGSVALQFLPGTAQATVHPFTPGIKLSLQVSSDPTPEELQFVQQMGVGYVNIPGNAATCSYENYARLKQKVEAAGLKVWNIGNTSVHNMEEVTLNLPGRDQKIAEYQQFLRNLGRAGIFYTTYAHMGNGIWSSPPETTRGGATARAFDMNQGGAGTWAGKTFNPPLSHGRVFTEEEIWENYTYFIKRVTPVAEEAGVRIGIHPDDPPVPVLGGVPRCIFGNFKGYVRAMEIANSPNVGICLCCGTWLEGGQFTGATVLQMIDHFGKQNKIWKIHFRNVSAPLPHFVETFQDNGYMDMYKIMKALRQVKFDGCVIGDHFPGTVGGKYVPVAYSIGYMRALVERANAEVKD